MSVAVGDNPSDHLRLGGPLGPRLRWWRLPPLKAGRGIYRGRGLLRPRLGLGKPAVGAVHVGVGPVGHRPVEEVVEPGNAMLMVICNAMQCNAMLHGLFYLLVWSRDSLQLSAGKCEKS